MSKNKKSTRKISEGDDQMSLNASQSPQIIDFYEIIKPDYNNINHDSELKYKSLIENEDNLCQILKTNLKNGIDTTNKELMNWRIKNYGTNKLKEEKPLSIIKIILECLEDPSLKALLISAIISLSIGLIKDGIKTGWIEGSTIFSAVFIVVGISSFLTYQEQMQFRLLNQENKQKNVLVIRNGQEIEINFQELLVGDLMKLKIGDILDVDGFLVGDQSKIQCDESAINGESLLSKKSNKFIYNKVTTNDYFDTNDNYITPILISGSSIMSGTGKMIICAVGDKSCHGRSQLLIDQSHQAEQTEEDLTPLKKQLNNIADLIAKFGYIMGILIGLIMIIKYIIIAVNKHEPIFTYNFVETVINAFILAITVIVVAIPEGLPMAVVIALAYSLKKMKNENNLVKNLDSSETMGNCNCICTDKTGTLTLGTMDVVSIFYKDCDNEKKFIDISSEDFPNLKNNNIKKNIIENIIYNISINKNSNVIKDMTEKALYHFIHEQKFISDNNEFNFIQKDPIHLLPFNSDYKCMMSLYDTKDEDKYILYYKGAYEVLAKLLDDEDSCDKEATKEIEKKLNNYSLESKRIITFAKKIISKEEIEKLDEKYPDKNIDYFMQISHGLKFQFIIGINDPLRKDVPKSIQICKNAGINVRMITGDNYLTALSIGKQSGIISDAEYDLALKQNEKIKDLRNKNKNENTSNKNLNEYKNIKVIENPIALIGEDFRIMSGGFKNSLSSTESLSNKKNYELLKLKNIEQFKNCVKNLKIIARASPEDKFLLVFGLKKLGNIVAVTGDGTNDAPALTQAHVGFSMGIRGTDIAKNASDIVLLNDSFSSIVTACKFGRNVYDCIRKFIQFQLTTNIVAVFMTLLGGIFLKDSPLNCIQMLWVNLIMDSLASLSLASESPNDDLLKRKPYKRTDSLLTKFMIFNVISQGIFQICILIIILVSGDKLFNVKSDRNLEHFNWNEEQGYHFTIFFNIFVFLQVFNSINARKLSKKDINVFKGIFDNFYYLSVQLFIIVIQFIIVTFGGRAVRCQRLSIKQHFHCICISSLSLVVGLLIKLLPFNEDTQNDVMKKEILDDEYASNDLSQTTFEERELKDDDEKKNN